MKTKAPAQTSAADLLIWTAVSAIGLWGTTLAVRAADDTPAQTIARTALQQKEQQTQGTTNQPGLVPAPAFPGVAPAGVASPLPPTIQPITVTADTDGWASVVAPAIPLSAAKIAPPTVSFLPAPSPADESLEQHTHGKIIGEFHADNLDLRTALALFASENNLNIVPDNDIAGTVTLDVHNLPLDQMMSALLEAGDCFWEEDNGLIRVRNTETRTFAVNYLRLKRNGTGNSSATLSSSTSTGGSVGGGSGGSSGGSGGGSSGGSGGSGGGSGGSASSSSLTLTQDNPTDFWTELQADLQAMLTEAGRKSLAINKTGGIIQITDRPSALKNVEAYLNATAQSVNRQVDIETKIYDVTLNDEFQFGIDWDHVAEAYGGTLGFGTTTLPVAIGSASSGLGGSSIGGLNTSPASGVGNTPTTLVFNNINTAAAITALKTQGNVTVVAAPRIRTLNNQTAVVKVGQELPFFSSSTVNSQSAGANYITYNDTVTTVTVGTILSITPQISADGWISMDICPVLTTLVQNEISPDKTATAPELTDKQASTMARVRNGTTVVLGGLIQTETDKNDTKVPLLGDIPLLGKLFTGTYHAKAKNELVIFVTPNIVETSEGSVKFLDLSTDAKH